MLPPFDFKVKSFTDIFDPNPPTLDKPSHGYDLWRWMWRDDNIVRLETASDLRKVAIEALQHQLELDFDDELIRLYRVKQMIGAMARQVLEHRGFEWVGKDYKCPTGDIFTTGAKFRRK